VQLKGLAEDRLGYEFVLLEDERGRQLPIWIGKCEAINIQFKLQAVDMPRPMTHDLVCHGIEKLGGRVLRLLIDDAWQNVFYAKLCVARGESEEEIQVDCRPSDGLAVALRAGAPILVRDDVLEEGKLRPPLVGSGDEDAEDIE
jgi:bifunctional DNase/RNase